MNRIKFLGVAGASVIAAAGSTYLLSDKQHFVRANIKEDKNNMLSLKLMKKKYCTWHH